MKKCFSFLICLSLSVYGFACSCTGYDHFFAILKKGIDPYTFKEKVQDILFFQSEFGSDRIVQKVFTSN